METAIICVSRYYGNTGRVAGRIGDELGAKVFSAEDGQDLSRFDMVGFGSGIEYLRHYGKLFGYVDSLPPQTGKKAFIFSTSGLGSTLYHRPLRQRLEAKGFRIVGEFACRGWWLLKKFGGMNAGHPDERDMENAGAFSRMLKGL